MLPDSAATLVAFLVFVMPGLMFELVAGRRRPDHERTTFRETSVVVVAGLVFSTASAAVLWLLGRSHPQWVINLDSWVRHHTYLQAHYRLVIRTAVLEVSIACGLAAIAASRLPGGTIRPSSGWFAVFRDALPENAVAVARAETVDGTIYQGNVGAYTPDDTPPSERELVLNQPLRIVRRGGTEQPIAWDRVVLTGSQIASLTVAYVATSAVAQPKRWRLRSPLLRD